MTWQRIAVLLAALALLPSTSFAQPGPRDRTARGLIASALEDYQNLEIDRAMERLQSAERACAGNGCSSAVTAKVYMAIGIVQVGGQQNTTAGVQSMVRALQLDSNAEPDAMLVTPEISAAFRQAQGSAGGGSTATTNNNANTNANTNNNANTNTNTTVTRPPPAQAGELLHTPAPEQLGNTPLPVYVEPSGTLNAAHVYVYYKGNGMRAFERREMSRAANGFGAEIPCAAMIAPTMEYYVTAVDSDSRVVATVGSETSPVQVSIVTRRSHPAPSLPGRAPPETCASDAEECPPGMTGPQCHAHAPAHGARSFGDPCASNSECGEGLHCDAGACAAGEASSSGDQPATPDPNATRHARFSFDLGGGFGLAFLSGRPSYAEQRLLVDSTGAVIARNCGDVVCYQTIDAGFAPTGFFAGSVRYNFTSRIGAAIGFRWEAFQAAPWTIPAAAGGAARSNPFADFLLSARAYYAFTPEGFNVQGFNASVFVGGGYGQIEPKPALPSSETRPGAHVLSGYGNVQVGARIEYGFRNGFFFAAEPTLQFMLPTFLFDIDVPLLVGFHL